MLWVFWGNGVDCVYWWYVCYWVKVFFGERFVGYDECGCIVGGGVDVK